MTRSPDEVDVFVGARIRIRRLMLGLSQEKLAECLGISFQQIQKYEKGANRVEASRLQTISTALQVPISFFFRQADGPLDLSAIKRGDDNDCNPVMSKQALILNQTFMTIRDPEIRKCVLTLAKSLAEQDRAELTVLHDDGDVRI